jgi:DNA-binding GntR family transcriptional regulator
LPLTRRRIHIDDLHVGDLHVGDSLAGLDQMAERYGCSWGTVREAQQLLVDEGLLSKIRAGVPTRVIAVPAQPEPDPALSKLRKVRRELDEIIADLEKAAA